MKAWNRAFWARISWRVSRVVATVLEKASMKATRWSEGGTLNHSSSMPSRSPERLCSGRLT